MSVVCPTTASQAHDGRQLPGSFSNGFPNTASGTVTPSDLPNATVRSDSAQTHSPFAPEVDCTVQSVHAQPHSPLAPPCTTHTSIHLHHPPPTRRAVRAHAPIQTDRCRRSGAMHRPVEIPLRESIAAMAVQPAPAPRRAGVSARGGANECGHAGENNGTATRPECDRLLLTAYAMTDTEYASSISQLRRYY